MEYEEKDWMSIAQYFYWDDVDLQRFSQEFTEETEKALANKPSSLSAIKSYLGLPTGNEQGTYLALDFGGTNVRASRVRLLGKHCFVIEKKISRPLRMEGKYDYMSSDATAEDLFDFIADIVREAAGGNKKYYLGHTFSFGVNQEEAGDGQFTQWSKEINVSGCEGRMINQMLREALLRNGLSQIEPVALLNDTTALLLAAGYQHGGAQIGIICGTGFNMCYYEPSLGMIVILEAGDYKRGTRTCWDMAVDEESQQPGYHQFEKMVSGAYLCQIYRQTVMAYLGITSLPEFTTEAMNRMITNETKKGSQMLMGTFWKRIVSPQAITPLRNIGAAIFIRGAQLTGAACYGLLRHLYPHGGIPKQLIAVEGSVFEHVRGSLFMTEDTLRICQAGWKDKTTGPVQAEAALVKDGPSIGAAIAAAMVSKGA